MLSLYVLFVLFSSLALKFGVEFVCDVCVYVVEWCDVCSMVVV